MKKLYTVLLSLIFSSFLASAQKKNEAFQLHIQRASSPIRIDGILNESSWQNAEAAKDFYMITPMDTSHANVKTEVRLTYDDQNIYMSAICYKSEKGAGYVVESLKRDFTFGKNDNFFAVIDTFDDMTNGFSFGANAAGAQWDGQMFEGGSINLNWDNKWNSITINDDEKWVFEAAIPFKSIRYKAGIDRWGINFSRLDLKANEKSAWAPVPRQFPSASLAYAGVLLWDSPPPTPKTNISVIPYFLTGFNKNYQTDQSPSYKTEVGGDVKIAVTSSMNLDLTVNPDFSQVDVDRQVTNLDRYELFFPERRQFFLENGDLFDNFGFANLRPFFSRRIGLNVPIRYGARLSGKLNKNWRLGVMDMQTGASPDNITPAQNFTVFALQRRVFARSNISALFVNKQSIDLPDTNKTVSLYNRNLGIEYNLASSNNIWTGKMVYMKSFSPNKTGDDFTHAFDIVYNAKKWFWHWRHEYVGTNYNAEVGYVPRKGYYKANPTITYNFYPKTPSSPIFLHGPSLGSTTFFDKKGKAIDHETYFSYTVNFKDRSLLSGWVAYDYVKLLAPFDPTNSGGDTLATGTDHSWKAFGVDYTSRPRGLFTYLFSGRYGGYYGNGSRLGLKGEMGYRFQPYVSLTLGLEYNNIDNVNVPVKRDEVLKNNMVNTEFWLISPRVDVTFTNKLFFTTYLQYNQQSKNVNLNARVQWRYKPASDLFLVYTDNYLPENFYIKNRAIVLKFTYWWNV
ncbi:Carbohydrate family 9 binding domain-like [Pseudarcicella hirudinis]|uniref:Carbohydrate family 9 binding domain-like n=1 Tax=Pseudarcicella hirudinis TaxID=1079859 RepID=A0A1I5SX80_9BACT|nr:DUF5916 domain-containing protein [Pseudarcicella hirudinis]SFP75251.1 Carbohydrate family 9 binding domain-like [Pseudarcicella hirudinis]